MPAIAQVTILLADEDALRRDGLVSVLSSSQEFQVVGGFSEGEAALEAVRRDRPDIAVINLNLPGIHGIDLVRRIRAQELSTRIVILAGTRDEAIIQEVMRAGADGYLLNTGPARHLLDAISYIRDGGRYFSPQLQGRLRDRTCQDDYGASNDLDSGSEEREYAIMSEMAEGIRPVLDRLDQIDNRVAVMEVGKTVKVPNPRPWPGSDPALAHMEARLPSLIEDAVAKRFRQMAGRLQQEIEETHVRSLETFARNLQAKLLGRVALLEQDLSSQAGAMNELRECSQRTEGNLGRLIAGVDKLAQEWPGRFASAAAVMPVAEIPENAVSSGNSVRRKSASRPKRLQVVALAVLAVLTVSGLIWFSARAFRTGKADIQGALPLPARLVVPQAGADVPTKMQAARQYVESKDYPLAEDMFKQVVHIEPGNVEALKGLATVLYRQDKIDESASILDKLPR